MSLFMPDPLYKFGSPTSSDDDEDDVHDIMRSIIEDEHLYAAE